MGNPVEVTSSSETSGLQVHKAAYFDPILSAHIKRKTKFDAMISLWMLDFGPYLAHRVFEAPLIYLQVILHLYICGN